MLSGVPEKGALFLLLDVLLLTGQSLNVLCVCTLLLAGAPLSLC